MNRKKSVNTYKNFKQLLLLWLVLLFTATLLSCASQREVRILHMNDFHGFAAAYKPYKSDELQGGFAYLAQRAEELRAEKPSLFLAAGDMIQGADWSNLFAGSSSVEAMNAMNIDAMVAGNHEFDFGQAVLRQRIAEAHFPVLGANIVGFGALKPYVIKRIDGLSVAIIGVVTDDTPVTTHPRNVTGLQFLSPFETVGKYVRELRGKADVIIVLSHLGLSADTELAKAVDGIDVIVGGHSHTKLDKAVLVGKTYIVQAFEHAKALGVLDLVVAKGGIVKADGRLESIRPVGKENEKISAIIKKYQQRVDAVMNETVGATTVDLDGSNVRKGETNLGNFVADVLRRASGADAAVINGGSIRKSLKQGVLKVGDIYNAIPFDNYVVAVRMTGKQIRDTVEHGVSAVEKGDGRFPQVSGLAFTYDPLSAVGSRVKEISVGGKPIVADGEYTVVTNDFMAAGGDGYKAFGDAVRSSKDYAVVGGAMKGDGLVYSNSGKWLRDVVVEFIRDEKEISPKIEGRIREVGKR